MIKGSPPHLIHYFAIVPKEKECDNLLVPVCLSATHIAYGWILWSLCVMVLSQSASAPAQCAIGRDENR